MVNRRGIESADYADYTDSDKTSKKEIVVNP
jgi:hypothetical protein